LADFNVGLSQPQGAGATPVAPVSVRPIRTENPYVALGLGLTEIFAKNQKDAKKAERESRDQAIVDEFTRQQTTINSALSSGNISYSEAQTRGRANFSKYAAGSPHLVESLGKVNKDLFENSQLGEAEAAVKSERDILSDERKQMANNGFVFYPGMSPEAEAEGRNAWRLTRQSDFQFERLQKRQAEARAMAGEERTQAEFVAKKESENLLAGLGDAHMRSNQSTAQDIVKQYQSGKLTLDQAKLLVNQDFMKVQQVIVPLSASNPSLTSGYTKMFSDIRDQALAQIEGKDNATVAENKLKELQAKIQLTALASSPEAAALYGTTKLTGQVLPTSYVSANRVVQETFARMLVDPTNVRSQIVGDKEAERPILDAISSQIQGVQSGRASDPEGTKLQLGNGINTYLQQVGSGNVASVEGLANASRFIASPEFAYAIQNGMVSKDGAARANQIIATFYDKEISRALDSKMDQTYSNSGGKNILFKDVVDVVWNGGGVSIVPKDVAGTDPRERQRVANNMKSSQEAINLRIKQGAHLEGNTNYAAFWEKNKHNILPSYFPAPAEGSIQATKTTQTAPKKSTSKNWWE
jgi:hypothetical protein